MTQRCAATCLLPIVIGVATMAGCARSVCLPLDVDRWPAPAGRETTQPVRLKCQPAAGYHDCVRVAVFIKGPMAPLVPFIQNIESQAEFFPEFELKRMETGKPLRAGSLYVARKKSDPVWSVYRVVAIDPPHRWSAEQVKGTLVPALKFDHRFRRAPGGFFSHEVVHFTPPFGVVGKQLGVFVRGVLEKALCEAHGILKAKLESKSLTSVPP